MKKLSIIFVAFFFVALNANAKKIEVLRKGSKDGVHYDRVSESHTIFADKLSCLSPGAVFCGWTPPPSIGEISSVEIENWVLKQVSNGRHSGSTKYNNKVYVNWKYTSENDELSIVMDDEMI